MSQQVRIVYIEANNPSQQVMESIQDFLHSLIDDNEQPVAMNGEAVALPPTTVKPEPTAPPVSANAPRPTVSPPKLGRPPKASPTPQPVPTIDQGRGQKVVVWVEESGKELTRVEAAELAGVHVTYFGQKLLESQKAGQREFRVKDKMFRIAPGVSLGA